MFKTAGILITIVVCSCLAQAIDVQDDSLLIDSFHAPGAVKAAATMGDTAKREIKSKAASDSAPEKKQSPPVSTDSLKEEDEADTSLLSTDTLASKKDTALAPTIDTISQRHETSKPEIDEPALTRRFEETPPAPELNKLSPFSSDRVHYLGLSLDYFSYAEVSNLSEIFSDSMTLPVIGAPKSTEYGFLFGLDYQGAFRKHGSPWLFRPNVAVQFGIQQTYDGSTQALPLTDRHGNDTAFQFLPVKFYKTNYFIQAGTDIGYCLTHAFMPFYAYSGIKFKFWYRDMLPDTTSYSNQITNAEEYYWFSFPLGLALSKPISPNLALGIDACLDLMFYGQMQALLSSWDSENTYETKSPAVTLSNRPGFRFEFSITYKTENDNVFQFAPYFTLYSFGQSETETSQNYVNGVYVPGQDQQFSEPSSSTWLLGAKLRILFMSPFTRTR
jgi:hypothetical protein